MPALLFLLSGCSAFPEAISRLPNLPQPLELTDTPFYPQERYQCGPAALATVLVQSGANVSLDGIRAKVFIPDLRGSLQVELLAATRTSDRIPYVVDGTLSGIAAELRTGRPVLVLQNLGVAIIPRWHYAAVIGIDVGAEQVILRSGTVARRVTNTKTFLHTWRRGDYWAMVALVPGELPAIAERDRYFRSVAEFEAVGRPASAAKAWLAALARWPDDPVAVFGLANAQYADNNYAEAEILYRKVLALHTAMPPARNNLAMTLAKLGRYEEALREIDRAASAVSDESLLDVFAATRAEVVAMRAGTDSD